ncbi:hypothetical protein TKK_0005133 [Trichogramma kaykai]
MSTLLRALGCICRANQFSNSGIATRIVYSTSTVNVLLRSKVGYFTNHASRYMYAGQRLTNSQNTTVEVHSEMDKKFKDLNYELKKYGRIKKLSVQDILQDSKESENLSSLQGLFLLQCCSELIDDKSPEVKIQLAEEIWSTLHKLGTPIDVSHYNALLTLYLENDHEFSPLDFLENMIQADTLPNRVTFQRLIAQFCNHGQVKEANQIIDFVKRNNVPITESILSPLIYGHAMNNDMESAMKIMDNMISSNITPTITTYATLLNCYARTGDINNVRSILHQCEEKNLWVPNKVLLEVIYHLTSNGHIEFIDEILAQLNKGSDYVKEVNRIIYKLIRKEYIDEAYKIFQTLPQTQTKDFYSLSGNYFIQMLIQFKVPIEKCIEYVERLTNEGYNPKAFMMAIQKTFAHEMFDSTIALMKAWKSLGGFVRESYFYSIFDAYGAAKDETGIKNVLQKMIFEFQINPGITTLRNYVLPHINGTSENLLSFFVDSQVNENTASNAILSHLLYNDKIQEAVQFMSNHSSSYRISMVKHNLLKSFKNTEDAPSFVWILHYLCMKKSDSQLISDSERQYMIQHYLDSCIQEAVEYFGTSNRYVIIVLFRNLVDKGLSLSSKTAESIKAKLSDSATPEVLQLLEVLGSGELIPKPIDIRNFERAWSISYKKITDIRKIEHLMKVNSITNSKSATEMKRKLLLYYSRTLNESKALEYLEDLKVSEYRLNGIEYQYVINMYTSLHNLEKAKYYFEESLLHFPNFKFNPSLVIKLATQLVEAGSIEDAKKCIMFSRTPAYSIESGCVKLLEATLKYNDEELMEEFLNLMKKHLHITKLTNSILNPFIELHLSRDDGPAAFEKFEQINKTYKLIPNLVGLMQKLITEKNEDLISKLEQMCNTTFGKTRTSFYMAIAYLKNNDLDECKNIIQEKCPNIYEEVVLQFAEKFYRQGDIESLEKLFNVLNTLKYDVENLCLILVKSYCSKNDWKKSYDLWTRMQEGDVMYSTRFNEYLNLAMKQKHIGNSEPLNRFYSLLHSQPHEAIRYLESIPGEHRIYCYSTLCEEFARKENFLTIIDLYKDLKENYNEDLTLEAVYNILKKMLSCKDPSSIQSLGNYISADMKKKLNYSYYLNQAHVKCGSYNLYLKDLESMLDQDLPKSSFSSMDYNTTIRSLFENSDLCQQFETLAYKFLKKNRSGPIHCLWGYYFLQNDPKAKKLWIKYVKNATIPFWLNVLRYLLKTKSIKDVVNLAELLNESSAHDKPTHYNKLIRFCLKSNDSKKYEYGLKCLQLALDDVQMTQLDMYSLAELQKGLEQSGMKWPWTNDKNQYHELIK